MCNTKFYEKHSYEPFSGIFLPGNIVTICDFNLLELTTLLGSGTSIYYKKLHTPGLITWFSVLGLLATIKCNKFLLLKFYYPSRVAHIVIFDYFRI